MLLLGIGVAAESQTGSIGLGAFLAVEIDVVFSEAFKSGKHDSFVVDASYMFLSSQFLEIGLVNQLISAIHLHVSLGEIIHSGERQIIGFWDIELEDLLVTFLKDSMVDITLNQFFYFILFSPKNTKCGIIGSSCFD